MVQASCRQRRYDLARAVYRNYALGVAHFMRREARLLVLRIQMGRDEPDGVNGANAVSGLHNGIQIEPVLVGPLLPVAHDARCGVNQDAVQVEEDGVTRQVAFIHGNEC